MPGGAALCTPHRHFSPVNTFCHGLNLITDPTTNALVYGLKQNCIFFFYLTAAQKQAKRSRSDAYLRSLPQKETWLIPWLSFPIHLITFWQQIFVLKFYKKYFYSHRRRIIEYVSICNAWGGPRGWERILRCAFICEVQSSTLLLINCCIQCWSQV